MLSKGEQALHDVRQFKLIGNTVAPSTDRFLEKIFAKLVEIAEDLNRFVEELQPDCDTPAATKMVLTEIQEIQDQLYSLVVQIIEANYK